MKRDCQASAEPLLSCCEMLSTPGHATRAWFVHGQKWSQAIAATTLLLGLVATPSGADGILPANDGTGTQVTPTGNDHAITGGATSADSQNLFHSFTEFNLLTGESATFITDPAILNILSRVTGGNASLIDGLLQVSGSNANLFLINPNGILFGPNSVLNLQGGFTAVTADQVNFADSAFGTVGTPDYAALVGDPQSFSFSLENPGSVVNAGTLSVLPGESVVLIGGQVLNTGTIAAPGGDIIISAVEGGNLVRIAQSGLLLNLEVETLTAVSDLPTTTFTPASLPELLTGNAIAQATGVTVNPDGTITLDTSDVALPTDPGTTIISGTLDATSGDRGGNITVLGNTLGLLGGTLDASGDSGGGTLRVGGDYTGQGPLPTAAVTFIDGASNLVADAIANGDGGTVIVWSDETTRSYGTLSARGGANGGNGGLVETSSLGFLDTQGVPDISAPNGLAGTWLLDPFDVQISAIAPTDTAAFPGGNPFIAQAGGPAIVSWLDLQVALGTGAGVTVTVSTGTGGGDEGNITVDDFNLSEVSAGATLELLAAGDIDLPLGLESTAGVNYDFQADTDNDGNGQINIDDDFSTNGGDVALQGAEINIDGFFDTFGGDITLAADSMTGNPAIDILLPVFSDGGDISLTSLSGDIVIAGLDAAGGDISIRTPDLIRVEGSPSIETFGGAAILVEHGGNGNVPFVVGDASTNGTFETITNGIDTVPFDSYLASVTFGNIEPPDPNLTPVPN
mgnify:CR=1 FL=1